MKTIRLAAVLVLLAAVAAQALIDEVGCKREYTDGDPNGQVYGFKPCDRAMSRAGQEWCFGGAAGTATGWVLCRGGGITGPVCNDGKVEGAENCDPGNPPTIPAAQGICVAVEDCLADCTCSTTTTCGNEVIDAGESCDPPGPRPDGRVCDGQCRLSCACGNGVVEEGCPIADGDEECDWTISETQFGNGLEFDNTTGARVNFGTAPAKLTIAANAGFTIYVHTLCVKSLPATGWDWIVYNNGGAAPNAGWSIGMYANGKFFLDISDGTNNGEGSTAAGTLQAGKCYGLAAQRLPVPASTTTTTAPVASVCSLFVKDRTTNGPWQDLTSDSNCTINTALANTGANVSIGGTSTQSMDAKIDHVVLFDSALDLTDIVAMDQTPVACDAAGVKWCIPMDEGSGTAVADGTTPTFSGAIIGLNAGTVWIPSPATGAAGEAEIGTCSWGTEQCNRTSCLCETKPASAVCSNRIRELGEQCDAGGSPPGTGDCGTCPDQVKNSCCNAVDTNDSCTCTLSGDNPPTQTLHIPVSTNCARQCPPVQATCTDGLPNTGSRECCATCAGAPGPGTPPNYTAFQVQKSLHPKTLESPNPVGSCEVANLPGAITGQQLEWYSNGCGFFNNYGTDRADYVIRNKFNKGFNACSNDWTWECTTNAQCASVGAGSCVFIPPDTSVWLRSSYGYVMMSCCAYCTGIDTATGQFTGCTRTAGPVMYDWAHPHFQKVWTAHLLAPLHYKYCSNCTGAGQWSPWGQWITQATCDAAETGVGGNCSSPSVLQPTCMNSVQWDNMNSAMALGVPVDPTSSWAINDSGPSRCTTDTPPLCHDGNGKLSREEYDMDLLHGIRAIIPKLVEKGLHVHWNASPTAQIHTMPIRRKVINEFAQLDPRAKIMIEDAQIEFGEPRRTQQETYDGDIGLDEALDLARWYAGKCTGAMCPAPTMEFHMGSINTMSTQQRAREPNVASALIARGLTGTRGAWSVSGTHYVHWFESGFNDNLRNWYFSPTVGIQALGEPVGEWDCAKKADGNYCTNCSDGTTLPLTGNPDCKVYQREYQNGAVFFHAGVTTECYQTTFNTYAWSGCPGACALTSGTPCAGTRVTDIQLGAHNDLTNATGVCILEANTAGTKRLATLGSSMTLDPFGAAIVLDSTCPA